MRRRVNRLVEKKSLAEQPDGRVFTFDVLKPDQRTPLDELNLQTNASSGRRRAALVFAHDPVCKSANANCFDVVS
jgi:hypothetical protein